MSGFSTPTAMARTCSSATVHPISTPASHALRTHTNPTSPAPTTMQAKVAWFATSDGLSFDDGHRGHDEAEYEAAEHRTERETAKQHARRRRPPLLGVLGIRCRVGFRKGCVDGRSACRWKESRETSPDAVHANASPVLPLGVGVRGAAPRTASGPRCRSAGRRAVLGAAPADSAPTAPRAAPGARAVPGSDTGCRASAPSCARARSRAANRPHHGARRACRSPEHSASEPRWNLHIQR